MSSAHALWWLALPLLLLPVWWHRQKRQRMQAVPLATARFLPFAAPQQLRVWQWLDRTLLLLRLLLLLGLIAWLADVAVPWRSDTVFMGALADPAAVEAQIHAAGLGAAHRSPLPDADPLAWLAVHAREWRADARLAIAAPADAVPMPARTPVLAHRMDLLLQPQPQLAQAQLSALTTTRHVVIASTRPAAWRALFAAFDSAGLGRERHVLSTEPDAQTDLIVWDRPGMPDAAWRAPLWWAVQPAAFPELAGARAAGGLRVADTARGRVWAQARWPVDEADPLPTARLLFENRDGLRRDPLPYAAPTMTLAAGKALSADVTTGAGQPLTPLLSASPLAPLIAPLIAPLLASLLAPLMALLFALERALAHVAAHRRHAHAVAAADPPSVAR